MNTCRECIEFLCAYLDGELPDEQRAIFDRHLAACPPCVAYVENYRDTVTLARRCVEAADDPDLPQMPEVLVQAILRTRQSGPGEGGERRDDA